MKNLLRLTEKVHAHVHRHTHACTNARPHTWCTHTLYTHCSYSSIFWMSWDSMISVVHVLTNICEMRTINNPTRFLRFYFLWNYKFTGDFTKYISALYSGLLHTNFGKIIHMNIRNTIIMTFLCVYTWLHRNKCRAF